MVKKECYEQNKCNVKKIMIKFDKYKSKSESTFFFKVKEGINFAIPINYIVIKENVTY